MPANCGVCDVEIDDVKSLQKCAGSCQRVFHVNCAKTDGVQTRNWRCETCTNTKKENSSTSSSNKVTATKLSKELFTSILEEFKKEVFSELKTQSRQIGEFKDSLQFMSKTIDDSNKLMNEVRKEYAEIKRENEQLKRQNKELSDAVNQLAGKVTALEQYSRRTNIEVSGIPVSTNEDPIKLLKDIGSAIGQELEESQVMAAHRIPSFRKDRPPSFIVQFQTKMQRDAWISSFKAKKTLTADEVHRAFPKNRVYINEHLAPENKYFLAQLKVKAGEVGVKYVWFRDGKFYVRKSDGEKCHKITNMQDLSKL